MTTLFTLTLFVLASAAIVLAWNRFFRPVPKSVAITLWLLCAAHQGATLLTPRVDLPANLAYVAYPWKATGRPAVHANTGIIFTQIAPWTRVARDVARKGEIPVWNRMSAGGSPLLANQQTAIFHPFTLLGLLLPLGKAFTLSASLRLFFAAFFTFVLLRNWEIGVAGALFGAVAFAFCSFHIVWLLFPLGLTTMMLPLCLVGVQELVRHTRASSFALLTVALALTVLGGHPESALWIWIATALFAVYDCATAGRTGWRRWRPLAAAACAFVAAMLLTAFFWYPTIRILRETPRFGAMQSHEANPANHGLSAEWLLPLVAPNVLGTPVNDTYTPPRGFHAAVLNDYGEVASGYAGLSTLGLALAAPFVAPFVGRRRPLLFAIALMIVSFLTFAEAPLWRDVVRSVPLLGISIHQRLRIFWDLGVTIAAALSVDAAVRGTQRRPLAIGLGVALVGFFAVYAVRHELPHDALSAVQFLVPPLTVALSLLVIWRADWRMSLTGFAAPLLILIDLAAATWNYNPSAEPDDVYPTTGAIAMLERAPKPFRIAAWGWSFLPETPSYYGIEDVKTTDPIQYGRYMRLLRGYLRVDPNSYDLALGDATQPFFDYLNIRYVYVPPDASLTDPRFVRIYDGPDGSVLENRRALPRYFFVRHLSVEPSLDATVWLSRSIRDYRSEALVDRIPEQVLRAEPALGESGFTMHGGQIHIREYGDSTTELDVTSNGWNLLITSDAQWPGWRAHWNGKRIPLVMANGAFVGCFVPPGRGRLTLRYFPNELTTGLRVSGGMLLILVVIGLMRGTRRLSRHRKESESAA